MLSTFSGITRLVLEEFQLTHQINIDVHNVYVRKLPNTRLRKDVEIARLKEYEVIKLGKSLELGASFLESF